MKPDYPILPPKAKTEPPEGLKKAMELDYMNRQLSRAVGFQSSSFSLVSQHLTRIQIAGIADT